MSLLPPDLYYGKQNTEVRRVLYPLAERRTNRNIRTSG